MTVHRLLSLCLVGLAMHAGIIAAIGPMPWLVLVLMVGLGAILVTSPTIIRRRA